MRKKLVIAVIALLGIVLSAGAKDFKLASPSGNIKVKVSAGADLSWSVEEVLLAQTIACNGTGNARRPVTSSVQTGRKCEFCVKWNGLHKIPVDPMEKICYDGKEDCRKQDRRWDRRLFAEIRFDGI